jgi:hypothetical protein
MSVEYTEMDNGCPALCFCSDLVVPITNKTIVQSFCNYIDNNMKFKIMDLHVQTLLMTFINNDICSIKAKVNGKFEFMGFVSTQDLYNAMKRVLERLKEGADEN